MVDKRVEILNKKILKLYEYIGEIEQSFDNLKNQKSSKIKTDEKELEKYHSDLLTCQSEKEQILKDLNIEIEKVKNSNLSNEEKSQQITKLTTENQKQFTETSQHLHSAWQFYHQIQQKVIAVLESKSQGETAAIKRLEQTKHNQFIVNLSLMVIILLISISSLFTKKTQVKKAARKQK